MPLLRKMQLKFSALSHPRLGFYQTWIYITEWLSFFRYITKLSSPPSCNHSTHRETAVRAIWKTKCPAKLKHFLWKALSWALAIKERLRSRFIPVDPACVACGANSESICHVLFQCATTVETWSSSWIPFPANRFSPGFVFLNLFHLVVINTRKRMPLSWERFPGFYGTFGRPKMH